MSTLANSMRPGSLFKLVIFGFILAILPLFVAALFAFFAVDDLAEMGKKTVNQVVLQTQKSRMLIETLALMERKAKHYLVFDDPSFQLDFEKGHADLRVLIDELSAFTQRPALAKTLQELASHEQEIYLAMMDPFIGKPEKEKATEAFAPASEKAYELWRRYSDLVNDEALNLEKQSQAVQRGILLQSSILLPISIVLVALFIYLIMHPVRQIESAIKELGAGNYDQPIEISGVKDLAKLGERLDWLRVRLKTLEEEKQRFLRNVSHELKTPLATICEGAELLADEVVGELNTEQKDIADILINSSHKLDKLIEQFVNYNQLTDPSKDEVKEVVDMRNLVQSVIEDYQIRLRSKCISVDERLWPVEVLGKPDQLRTIVDNLLSNAVKYSPSGGEIKLTLRRIGKHMEMEVEDEGPGIEPDERAQVFQPFYKVRTSQEAGIPGTGLGLAIVSECVTAHHGYVEAMEPRPNKTGARIKVLIPLES
jgi:two-component system sensor histidine kinase GlrK